MEHIKEKAGTLIEALPYIQKYSGKIVVIKYGGAAMADEALKKSVMTDIVLLNHVGMKPVIVHGGGPNVSAAMKKAGIEPKFVKGLRVTDKKTMGIVHKEFEKINKELVETLKNLGSKAISVVGTDNKLINVTQKDPELGFVGDIKKINPEMIHPLIKDGYIPVISPVGVDDEGSWYNINADTAAASIATALNAEKLTLLTDVDGVFEDKKLVPTLTTKDVEEKISKEVIHGGMIPKTTACKNAVDHGCKKAHLINGKITHALLLEIFTDKGVGTEIVK
ncbi:acetylglutamate kinase [Candidatus Woesearchaeota archaeon]|nr:acetylglutamate kinase [Candidatus Woesearchaeota archaeon]